MSSFVLVHSPLTGPLLWSGVAEALGRRKHRVTVPDLRLDPDATPPYWAQQAGAAASALGEVPPRSPLILIGHSGGGPILPAIAAASERPIAAILFVDSDIPEDGASRLDLFATDEEAEAFRARAQDGMLPPFTDEDLREALPNPELRARFLAELRPVPLAAYEEPIPTPPGWEDLPCGYLRLSDAYREAGAEAREHGWAYAEIPGSHLLPLTDPSPVVAALVLLCARLGVDLSRR